MFYRLKNIGKGLRRFAAAALAVLSLSELAAGIVPGAGLVKEAQAADLVNTYVLQVSTGANDGDGIAYFTIEYVDTNGKRQVEAVFPETAYGVTKSYGNTQLTQRLGYAEEMGFELDNWELKSAPLMAMSTDCYILRLTHTIRDVTAIGVHADVRTSWTVRALQLFKATAINGTAMYGYISPDTYLNFSGTLLAQADISGTNGMKLSPNGPGEAFYFGNPQQTDLQTTVNKLLCYPSKYNRKKADYTENQIVYKQFADEASYQKVVHYSTAGDECLVEINLADVYGGGIDVLTTLLSTQWMCESTSFEECLSITMRYKDTTGNYRQVFLPITVSVLCWYNETMPSTVKKLAPDDLAAFAYQGESLRFVGNFPSLDEVVELYVCYGPNIVTTAARNAGVARVSTYDQKDTTFTEYWQGSNHKIASIADRVATIVGTNDSIAITGINLRRVTADSKIDKEYSTKHNNIVYKSITGTEVVSYYKAPTEAGVVIQPDNFVDILDTQIVSHPTGSVGLKPAVTAGTYRVSIQTDTIAQAGTINDMTATLYYTDTDGHEQKTTKIDLADALQEYYPYWASVKGSEYTEFQANTFTNMIYRSPEEIRDDTTIISGTTTISGVSSAWNGAYRYGASTGKAMEFFVQIDDVALFTGMDIAMDSDIEDDYQFTAVKIDEVSDKGNLFVEFVSGGTYRIGSGEFESVSDRIWTRKNLMVSSNKLNYVPESPVLVQNENIVHVDFSDSEGMVENKNTDVNSAIGVSSVTYQEALRNYELTETRTAYEIRVKVADDNYTSISDGDTGSQNQFYFQLVFDKDGTEYTSSYVNANQQLEGDGFRAGETVSFKIYTNGDYGDVKKVNIIPDDLSSSGDNFDKLKIDTIAIDKTTSDGMDKTYVIENVGWIDIEVNDDEADYIGRPASELVRSFAIQRTTYTTNLEFALLNSSNTIAGGIKGEYSATIRYRDSSGQIQPMTIDLVGKLQDYLKNQASTADESADALISDTSYMFLPNRTNRFTVKFDNITELIDITFMVKAKDAPATGVDNIWGVQNLSVRQVCGNGVLRLKQISNDSTIGEYIRDYGAGNAMNICTQRDQGAQSISINDTAYSKMVIAFGENKITTIDPDDGSIVLSVEPHESVNDVAELSVMAKTSAGLVKNDKIIATVRYQTVYGDSYEVAGVPLYYNPAENAFISDGLLEATLFCIPTSIELTAEKDIYISRVDLTQIRDEDAVAVFNKFGIGDGMKITGNATSPTVLTLAAGGTATEYEDKYSQTVYLRFADDCRYTAITSENDVLVSFRYQLKDDRTRMSYTSDTRSLSAYGIDHIAPGMVVAIPFVADLVENITDVVLTVTHDHEDTKNNIKGMTVRVNQVSVGQKIVIGATSENAGKTTWGWFNCDLAQSYTLTEKKTYFSAGQGTAALGIADEERLCPVEITVKTAANDGVVTSTPQGKVSATFVYSDQDKRTRRYTVDDLGSILLSGSLTAGDTATARVLLPGAVKILQVSFEPVDSKAESTDAWKIESLSMTCNVSYWADETGYPTTILNQWAYEGTPLDVNVSGVLLKGTLKYPGGSKTVTNADLSKSFSASSSGYFSLVSASQLAVPEDVTWVTSACVLSGDAEGAQTVLTSGSFNFQKGYTYRIRVYPKQIPSLVTYVDVVMPAADSSTVINNYIVGTGTNLD